MEIGLAPYMVWSGLDIFNGPLLVAGLCYHTDKILTVKQLNEQTSHFCVLENVAEEKKKDFPLLFDHVLPKRKEKTKRHTHLHPLYIINIL